MDGEIDLVRGNASRVRLALSARNKGAAGRYHLKLCFQHSQPLLLDSPVDPPSVLLEGDVGRWSS